MIVALIVFIIYSLTITYVLVVQILREKKLEDIANSVVERMEKISEIVNSTKKTLNNERLTVAFSNDDEVGRFFSQIKEIQDNLADYVMFDNGEERIE